MGITNRSLAEFDKSLSCQRGIFPSSISGNALSSLARLETRSQPAGLRLEGTAELPI